MRSLKLAKAVFLISILVGGLSARAGNPSLGGGGDGIPTPFEANQKVELADGESYLLVGRVVLQPAITSYGTTSNYKAYFEVDLEEHPWLATTHRKLNPYYPLDGAASYWKQFRGMKIRLACQAHGIIATGGSGKPEYTLMLRRLSDSPVEPFQD